MRERFAIRSVYVKAPFHDFALSSNSPIMVDHCTRQQFVQGLSRLGIEPNAADLDLLFRKYDDLAEGSVNYVAFSVDVDPTETFSSRERLPAAPVPQTTFTGGFRVPTVHYGLLMSLRGAAPPPPRGRVMPWPWGEGAADAADPVGRRRRRYGRVGKSRRGAGMGGKGEGGSVR